MKKGIHFDDMFSPCTRLETLRLITVVAINNNWNISHADIPNAYLHEECENFIFTRLPKHWNKLMGDALSKDGNIVVLVKTLYSAPHAGRRWHKVIDNFLHKLNFTTSPIEPSLYLHTSQGTIITLYVDNLFITGPDTKHKKETLNALQDRFNICDNEQIQYALGIRFQYFLDGSVFLSQEAYMKEIVSFFKVTNKT